MRSNSHKYFANKECPYWPCHDLPAVNCLFCFCPLYHLQDCGGNWTLTAKGVKDCSRCGLPHGQDGWDKVVARLTEEAKKTVDSNDIKWHDMGLEEQNEEDSHESVDAV